MSGYAESTSVSPEKTKAEIETTLRRYGADGFVSGWDSNRAFVMFRCKDRSVRFVLNLPDNTTVGQWAATAIPAAYTTGQMPGGLLALPAARTDQ